jgi:hypothetical protein
MHKERRRVRLEGKAASYSIDSYTIFQANSVAPPV